MIPHLRLSRPRAALLLISLALAAGPVTADPLIARAQQQGSSGDSESASKLYRSWLVLNEDAPGSAAVFSRYLRLERDVPALLESCERFISKMSGASDDGEQLILVARVFELAGRVEKARDAYMRAYTATGSETALLSSALLSLEMNDLDTFAKNGESLKGKDGDVDSLVSSLVTLQAGDSPSARAALLAFAESSGNRDLSLKALWVVYSNATAAGDQQSAAEALRRLTAGFPGAPETALASGGTSTGQGRALVVALPRPDLPPAVASPSAPDAVQSGTAPPPAVVASTPQDAPSRPAAAAVRMAVQAGAFQVRENADDLVTDLLKRGFHPSVREESIQGVAHYKVFAGTGLASDQAKELLSRLLLSGFSGFLVVEK